MNETDSYTKKAMDCIKNIALCIDEKYDTLSRPGQNALCSSIAGTGLVIGLYLAATESSWLFFPCCIISGASALYLDRKNILNDYEPYPCMD